MDKTTQSATVLITGASTGLGLALAQLLAKKQGFHLILTARPSSMQRFQEAGIRESKNIWLRELDVTNRWQRENLMSEILSHFDGLDFLINNAGIAYRSVAEHIEPMELIRQMNTNFYAPLGMIRLALPSMRRRRKGHIINVSSVSGMMAMPTMGLYSSSKFALEGLTESLWYEVKPWNIKVTLIEPGFIQSDAFKKVPWTRKALAVRDNEKCPYHPQYRNMEPFIERVMNLVVARPESVAKKILKVMNTQSPSLRVRVTFDAILFDLMKRFLPSRFYHWFLYRSLPGVKSWGQSQVIENDDANFLVTRNQKDPMASELSLTFVESEPEKKSSVDSPPGPM